MDLIEEITTEWDNPSITLDDEIIKKFEYYLFQIYQHLSKLKTKLFIKEYESVRDVHVLPMLTSPLVRQEYKNRSLLKRSGRPIIIKNFYRKSLAPLSKSA